MWKGVTGVKRIQMGRVRGTGHCKWQGAPLDGPAPALLLAHQPSHSQLLPLHALRAQCAHHHVT